MYNFVKNSFRRKWKWVWRKCLIRILTDKIGSLFFIIKKSFQSKNSVEQLYGKKSSKAERKNQPSTKGENAAPEKIIEDDDIYVKKKKIKKAVPK